MKGVSDIVMQLNTGGLIDQVLTYRLNLHSRLYVMPKCSLCNENHATSRCPGLWNPLKEGFFEGGGSGQSHDHDDEKVESIDSGENMSQDSIKTIESSRHGLFDLLRSDDGDHWTLHDELRA